MVIPFETSKFFRSNGDIGLDFLEDIVCNVDLFSCLSLFQAQAMELELH